MARLLVLGASAVALMSLASPAIAAERGIASAYPYSYHGRRTASGERFDPRAMTCAHKSHPFGSMLRVSTGARAITCRVTDRGPFVRGRIIDLTPVGIRALGISALGQVTVQRL